LAEYKSVEEDGVVDAGLSFLGELLAAGYSGEDEVHAVLADGVQDGDQNDQLRG
jgi:hypothetical protein